MRKGFTLVELLVVITILSILMAVLIPNLVGGQTEAKKLGCKQNLTQLIGVIQSYLNDEPHSYPFPGDGGIPPDPKGVNFWQRYVNTNKLESSDDSVKTVKLLKCPFNATTVGYGGPSGNMNEIEEYDSKTPVTGDIIRIDNNEEASNHGPTSKSGVYAMLKGGSIIEVLKKDAKAWDLFRKKVVE